MDPYLKIGPFKIEELNEEPIVLMFHDFLPNVETNEIISRASSKLFMSTTGFAGEASQNMQLRLVSNRCMSNIQKQLQVLEYNVLIFTILVFMLKLIK